MAAPRLLLEAASSYRGDQEDRLTELLAVALHEHSGFCGQLLAACGIKWTPSELAIATQQTFPSGPARIDLVLRARDAHLDRQAVIFVESKYNPDRRHDAYWFTDEQANREASALHAQPEPEKHLVAIASDHDLAAKRPVPRQYERTFRWNEIAELAYRAGGQHQWQLEARSPNALASQRVLLEFWSYLKGDTVGAITAEDLLALGAVVRASDRVSSLLERVADDLKWEDSEDEEWVTASENPIRYIVGNPEPGSWPTSRDGAGSLYALITYGEWDDASPQVQPQLYAGAGFDAKREERNALRSGQWPDQIQSVGLSLISDPEGIYVFARQPLADLIDAEDSLSGQVAAVAEWVREAVAQALGAPEPPQLQRDPAPRKARHPRTRPSAPRRRQGGLN